MKNHNVIVDVFNPEQYSEVVSEITVIKTYVAPIVCNNKSEIVISFLKNHCLKNIWLKDSAALTNIIISGFFKTSHVERLFDSAKDNAPFLKSYERFIQTQLD